MRLHALATLKFIILSLALAPGFALDACDSGDGGGDCGDAGAPSFTEIDWSSCTQCHDSALSGDARQGAPDTLNYDEYASANAKSSQTASRVGDGTMPPTTSDGPALSAEAEAQILDWANCGAPQ
jgi:hypothetical protein